MLVIHRVPVLRATRKDHTRRHQTLGGMAIVGARCATGRTRELAIGRRYPVGVERMNDPSPLYNRQIQKKRMRKTWPRRRAGDGRPSSWPIMARKHAVRAQAAVVCGLAVRGASVCLPRCLSAGWAAGGGQRRPGKRLTGREGGAWDQARVQDGGLGWSNPMPSVSWSSDGTRE